MRDKRVSELVLAELASISFEEGKRVAQDAEEDWG